MTSSNDQIPNSASRCEHKTTPTESAAATQSTRRKHVMLGLRLLIGMLVIAAPVLVASQFVTGVTGVAFYGVLAAAFGWIAGGPKTGVTIVASLSILGVAAILLTGQTLVLALLLLALGVLYGYAAGKGFGSAVVQLAILTPYFMMDPPGLFSEPPVIGPAYIGGVVVVMMLSGLWTVCALHVALPGRRKKHINAPDRRMPLLYGTILGAISALVMVIGTTTDLKSHWVWVTLTLYVLADPAKLVTQRKMVGRVIGTLAGFGVVTLLALSGIPDPVLQLLALPALWFCLYQMILKKPYWQYSLFLTVAVVLMNSYNVNTLLLDAERFGFTIIGALLSVLAAFLVNLLHFHRRGLSVPVSEHAPESC